MMIARMMSTMSVPMPMYMSASTGVVVLLDLPSR
jgi:hypothetical protein